MTGPTAAEAGTATTVSTATGTHAGDAAVTSSTPRLRVPVARSATVAAVRQPTRALTRPPSTAPAAAAHWAGTSASAVVSSVWWYRYCSRRNVRKNRFTLFTRNTVPTTATTRGDRSHRGSTIPARRRATPTRVAAATTATASATSAWVAWASVRASTARNEAVRAAAPSAIPASVGVRSSVGRRTSVTGTVRRVRTAVPAARRSHSTGTGRQPTHGTSTPTDNGTAIDTSGAIRAKAPKPWARLRRSGDARSSTAMPTMASTIAPTPASASPSPRTSAVGLAATTSAPAAKVVLAPSSTGRGPNRSASAPARNTTARQAAGPIWTTTSVRSADRRNSSWSATTMNSTLDQTTSVAVTARRAAATRAGRGGTAGGVTPAPDASRTRSPRPATGGPRRGGRSRGSCAPRAARAARPGRRPRSRGR